jgi:predicted nucleotidyltransferase
VGVLDARVKDKALAAAAVLARLGTLRAAYVFGSYAEGRGDQWSDIDLAAFVEGVENWDLARRAKAMALVMTEAGADVEAHLFPASALANPERGGFAEYVLQHGVCIQGHIDCF